MAEGVAVAAVAAVAAAAGAIDAAGDAADAGASAVARLAPSPTDRVIQRCRYILAVDSPHLKITVLVGKSAIDSERHPCLLILVQLGRAHRNHRKWSAADNQRGRGDIRGTAAFGRHAQLGTQQIVVLSGLWNRDAQNEIFLPAGAIQILEGKRNRIADTAFDSGFRSGGAAGIR